tara:strand:- start:266 stop:598 length:333 start_codon:yes stop_codon:yes gene_type:complete
LFGGQAVSNSIELVTVGVHPSTHSGTGMASFTVHGLIVATLAQRTSTVGVGIRGDVLMHKRTDIAYALCSNKVNRQISATIIAFCFHLFQLQGSFPASVYKEWILISPTF